MRVFALEFPLHKPGISFFHYRLFHGVQALWPHSRPVAPMYGDLQIRPLALIHNARRIPAVYSPDMTLVVSSGIADQLCGLPFTMLRPVLFARLVDCTVPLPGDYSFTGTPTFQEADVSESGAGRIHDYLPDAPEELRAGVGRYFELIPTRLKDASRHFPEAGPVRCVRPYTVAQTNELVLSPALVEAYPVTWWDQTVLHERVYRILEPHLDPAYAEVVQINL